jgi:DNA repair exonuclease SbcCD nuclease subunit
MNTETIKFNNTKIAVISDLHLGVHTNSTFWYSTAIEWAKWLRDQLNEQKITDIIFCGDWYHNRSEISVYTLQVSADILNILSDFNLIIIAGNHDMFFKNRTDVNSLSIFKNRKNVTIVDVEPITITHTNKTLTLCPWGVNIDEIPKCDAIFGHFEIESFSMNAYKICEKGIQVKDLLTKSPLVISGHFHIRHSKQYGSGTIMYVGNPFQMDYGDVDNEKGYHIFDLNTLECSFIKNSISPEYKKISLSELIEAKEFTQTIKRTFHNNIVKLKIDKNIAQEDVDLLLSKLNLLSPAELTVDYDINFNRLIGEVEDKKDFSGIDIEQAIYEFVNLLDVENKKDIIDYTTELYRKCIL